jgi:excisionase family DNA binding protein
MGDTPRLDPVLTVVDASPLTGLSVSELYAKARRREIPHLRYGRAVRFTREHVAAIREQYEVLPKAPTTAVAPPLRTRQARGPQRRSSG